jgi:NAD(P)-dependent dehydrogenase (short-subunit alcohol dehydrogenase family)
VVQASNGRVALVVGSSRGIGKGCALELAARGFDVALASRTLHEGDGWEPLADDHHTVPGSIESTATAVEAAGVRALPVQMDLSDRASVGASVQRVLDEWGRVDVLVNNALHVEPGHNDRFLDVPVSTIEREIDANVVSFVVLTKLVLPGMLERGDGTIVNLTSTAGYMDPPVPSGEGGWSVTYALVKGSFHRLAGMLALELGDRGIKAFNVQPGFVLTERMEAMSAQLGIPWDGAPPNALGAVVAWLATEPEAAGFNGKTVEGQAFALERGLYPDWRRSEADIGSLGRTESVWS